MKGTVNFKRAILDAIDEQIVIINEAGVIEYVNHAWISFNKERQVWLGTNFLDDIQDLGFYHGILMMLSDKSDKFVYQQNTGEKCFLVKVSPLHGNFKKLFCIIFIDITTQKIVEHELERLSVTDALTGLANRRSFDLFLDVEWNRCRRLSHPISMVLLDVDNFKSYNDTKGHVAGDEVLRKLGQILRDTIHRGSDLSCRYGGEEFAIILGNTTESIAKELAERVRCELYGLNVQGPKGVVTVSIGVASTIPAKDNSSKELVIQADQALYQAKANGKNRVEIYK